MPATQPRQRIKNAEKEVVRLRDDVIQEDWRQRHAAPAGDRWSWEDLVAKANFFFDRIMDLDADIQESALTGRLEYDPGLLEDVRGLVGDWRRACLQMLPHLDRLEAAGDLVEGAPGLRENLSEAGGILTDDPAFFAGDALARLRDEAIDDHRGGLTEPMPHGGAGQ